MLCINENDSAVGLRVVGHLSFRWSDAMTADVAVARARLQDAQGYLGDASNRLSDIRERHKQKMCKEAAVLAGNAAAHLTDADFEAMRGLRLLRSPPSSVQLIARCASTLVSADLPGSRSWRRATLLSWDETKKVFARTDLPICIRRFNAARLVEASALTTMVGNKALWSTAATSAAKAFEDGAPAPEGTSGITYEAACSTSSVVGALFFWVARLLGGIEELQMIAAPSAEETAEEAAVQTEVTEKRRVVEAAEAAVREAEERARREAEEKARREAEEKVRREAEEKARRKAEEKFRREAEERARREAEERVRREAEERREELERKLAEAQCQLELERLENEAMARELEEREERETLREIEAEIEKAKAAEQRAEQEERRKRRAFEQYLATESTKLEVELRMRSEADGSAQRQRLAEQEDAEACVLQEAREAVIKELMALAPSAGRERCRAVLERHDFDLTEAAYDLLEELSMS